jgi:hypothetical protein
MEHRKGAARSNRSSGIRGVYWDKQAGKWLAMAQHNGKNHNAGRFDTIVEAEHAVIAKRLEVFTHSDGR